MFFEASLILFFCKIRVNFCKIPGRVEPCFTFLYHSAEMKGRIPKLNVVSKTLEGLLALYNVTVGPIAAVYPQEGYRKKW